MVIGIVDEEKNLPDEPSRGSIFEVVFRTRCMRNFPVRRNYWSKEAIFFFFVRDTTRDKTR